MSDALAVSVALELNVLDATTVASAAAAVSDTVGRRICEADTVSVALAVSETAVGVTCAADIASEPLAVSEADGLNVLAATDTESEARAVSLSLPAKTCRADTASSAVADSETVLGMAKTAAMVSAAVAVSETAGLNVLETTATASAAVAVSEAEGLNVLAATATESLALAVSLTSPAGRNAAATLSDTWAVCDWSVRPPQGLSPQLPEPQLASVPPTEALNVLAETEAESVTDAVSDEVDS